MAEGSEAGGRHLGKVYHKPEIARVDLIEDEVALASCKKSVTAPTATSGVLNMACKSSCKGISST